MNRYKVTKQLGDGTYGSVLKAVNRQTGEVVSDFLDSPTMMTCDCRPNDLIQRRLRLKK